MALNIFETPSLLTDSAAGKATYVAAPDVNRLRTNALFLDMLTLRGRTAWTDTLIPSELYGGSPFEITACSFQFRTGMTTATFLIYSVIPGGTHTARVFFDGVQVTTAVLTGGGSGGFQTINVTLSGLTDYQIVDVIIDVTVVSSSTPATYRVVDAYVHPLTGVYTTAYPGVPTFGTVNASALNQLANAQIWVWNRVALAHQPVFMGLLLHVAHAYVSTKIIWTGSAVRANNANRLYVAVGAQVVTNVAEFWRLTIGTTSGGVDIVVDSPTFTLGPYQQLHLFDVDISARSDGVPFPIELRQHVITAGAGSQQGTRFTLFGIFTARNSAPAITVPAISQPRESLTYALLQTRLTQIATLTNNAAVRVQAAADIFNRVRCFRWRPGLDAGQRQVFKDTMVAIVTRRTDAIWVRGKNVKLGYGAIKVTRIMNDPWTYEFQYSHDLTSGDEVQNKLIYLDTFEGLFPGVDMFFHGEDLRYVAEHWG